MRERLWPLVARRATAAVYRRSRRHEVARRHAGFLVDAPGPLPQPRLEDQLAVWLADALPSRVVGWLGVRGVRRIAGVMGRALRLAGRMAGIRRTGGAR